MPKILGMRNAWDAKYFRAKNPGIRKIIVPYDVPLCPCALVPLCPCALIPLYGMITAYKHIFGMI